MSAEGEKKGMDLHPHTKRKMETFRFLVEKLKETATEKCFLLKKIHNLGRKTRVLLFVAKKKWEKNVPDTRRRRIPHFLL